jgi:hypothetical protein
MRKPLLLFVLVAILVLLVGPYAPYWVLMIGVVILSFLLEAGNFSSFLASGLSFGLTWMVLTLHIMIKTDSELPKRMAELMGLVSDNQIWFGTALLGFLIGGFSGLTGTMLKNCSK